MRFIDFKMNGQFRYTIAVCRTDSHHKGRDALFDLGKDCVSATGWYPLPQAERLGSAASARAIGSGRDLPMITSARLSDIAAATDGSDGGTAVRVTFSDGASLLLDAGFGIEEFRSDSDRLVLISHHHRDHIGGLERGRFDGLPVGMPAATARGLDAQGRLEPIRRPKQLSP
ncbi:hypothetical protein [Kribbella jejuensis]|uniref:hypothetical protein n=1 Tax=Kribbella jejuensis TaxID=236068 RepID=UPI0011530F30|nr:hypothetical protein [Kribbella jejuensis]